MTAQIHITRCRHDWPENAGWIMNRPLGINEYVFLHFLTPVDLLLNSQIHHLPANSCLFYNIGTPQWFTSSQPIRHNWMHISGNLPPVLEHVGLQLDTIYHPHNSHFITHIAQTVEAEFLAANPMYDEMIDAYLQRFLIQLSRNCYQTEHFIVPADAQQRLSEIRTLVLGELSRNWTVAEIAALSNYSPSYFHSLYKEYFQISPMEDLICARIDAAKNLLSGTSTTISEIAYSLGYSSETHFCRQFRKRTGVTASDFRATSMRIPSRKRKKRSK